MSRSDRVLVDSNVWIDFLVEPVPELRELSDEERVITHPCVIGEVMVGQVRHRAMILEFLLSLPMAQEAEWLEVIGMLDSRKLAGRGLQWNDALLLASAQLSGARLWTRDKRLAAAADELGVGWRG